VPPRYAFWTILIDGKATAFRARDRDELLPTFNQLARKNPDIVMKYFARGRLWDTPEQAQWAAQKMVARTEKRSADWRPGGSHEDPRKRFVKRDAKRARPHGPSHGAAPKRSSRPAERRPRRKPH
jgi:hypothetical protein